MNAPVEQVDREAAAALSEALAGKSNGRDQIAGCRAGEQDETFLVQAFAAVRLAERERCAKIADDAVTYVVGEKRDLCDRIATAIRSPAHVG